VKLALPRGLRTLRVQARSGYYGSTQWWSAPQPVRDRRKGPKDHPLGQAECNNTGQCADRVPRKHRASPSCVRSYLAAAPVFLTSTASEGRCSHIIGVVIPWSTIPLAGRVVWRIIFASLPATVPTLKYVLEEADLERMPPRLGRLLSRPVRWSANDTQSRVLPEFRTSSRTGRIERSAWRSANYLRFRHGAMAYEVLRKSREVFDD